MKRTAIILIIATAALGIGYLALREPADIRAARERVARERESYVPAPDMRVAEYSRECMIAGINPRLDVESRRHAERLNEANRQMALVHFRHALSVAADRAEEALENARDEAGHE